MIEEKIFEKITGLGIKPEDIEIHTEVDNGYYVIYKDKDIEKDINNYIKHIYFEHILTNKVKSCYKTWGNFNKSVEKSYRNKSQIIEKLVSLSELLKELNIKIKLV